MDRLQEILSGLNFMGHTSKAYTPEEMEKMRVDSFNSSEGSLHLEDDYNCSICRNKGLVMKAVEIREGYWSTTSNECKCMECAVPLSGCRGAV
jgi:hypothetical protein